MSQVITIGLDIAKNVFHAHGADARGAMVFSRKLTRGKLLDFFAGQPACTVALEACGGAHHCARELLALGHEVRLIPPAYVKPFVKRHKNDAVDAEAICEAAQRPGMRFVAVERGAASGRARVPDPRSGGASAHPAHQRDPGPLGRIWLGGTAPMTMLADLLEDEEMTSTLPEAARPMFKLMVDLLGELGKQIAAVDREIVRRAKEDDAARRLMTIPGIGPIAATAIIALAPPIETFRKGRDFAAWLGLAPRQHSTGGKQRPGSITKMGERTIRRLLIIGASSVVLQACRHGAPAGSWLERMLARKPRMLVSVALANKMARMVWALLTKKEDYSNRPPFARTPWVSPSCFAQPVRG